MLARLSTGVVALEPDLRDPHRQPGGRQHPRRGSRAAASAEASPGSADRDGLLRQFSEACRSQLAAGETEWREQIVFRCESGRRVLMCACTPLPARPRRPGGYVLVFDDITAMLQAQREAAWGEVARRLAHEIKNPLTPIRLSAERMRHKLMPPMNEQDAQLLDRGTETIVQQVEAMKEMVNAFSEYARAPRFEMTRLDLNQLVTEVTDLYRAQETGRGVTLDAAARPGARRRRRGSRAGCASCCTTCCTNAVEALEGQPGGEISIATRRVRARRRRGRRDHGRGQRPRLPARADAARSSIRTSRPRRRAPGSGSRSCARSSRNTGGTSRRTIAPKAGRAIRIELPLNEATGPGRAARCAPAGAQEGACMSNARILVVDDEADIRELVQEILTEEGYDVDVAANAAEARAACATTARPTSCCSTSGCPTPTASACCASGSRAQSLAAPVVMMSGHGTVETAVEATRLGAVDYVEKPLSLAKLLRTVRSALEEGGRRKQARAQRCCRRCSRRSAAAS